MGSRKRSRKCACRRSRQRAGCGTARPLRCLEWNSGLAGSRACALRVQIRWTVAQNLSEDAAPLVELSGRQLPWTEMLPRNQRGPEACPLPAHSSHAEVLFSATSNPASPRRASSAHRRGRLLRAGNQRRTWPQGTRPEQRISFRYSLSDQCVGRVNLM